MNLLVVLFIVAIVVVGYGVTMVLDLDLAFEERVLYGVILGSVVVSTVGFFFGWWAGMSRGTVVVSGLFSIGRSRGRRSSFFRARAFPTRMRIGVDQVTRLSRSSSVDSLSNGSASTNPMRSHTL